jgi:glycosyltransferase involved in cell wall biosynthesis
VHALPWTPLRWHSGLVQFWRDRAIGRFAAGVCRRVRPDACYAFTQVGFEVLQWARAAGVPSVVECPNGHIRGFRDVYVTESSRLCGSDRYRGHPNRAMVARVEQELVVADRVRVSSDWARRSLVDAGIAAKRVTCLQQPVDLERFTPVPMRRQSGPLRVCFVGMLDLRKGFVYLLRAARLLPGRIALRFVGATGDRCCRALLARERIGLDVEVRPGDPRPALAEAEVFALPTLEDGSPFAVAEAMACARPVITTRSTGAAEWVRHGETGWIVGAACEHELAAALECAIAERPRLPEMGAEARRDAERRAGTRCDEALAAWVIRA